MPLPDGATRCRQCGHVNPPYEEYACEKCGVGFLSHDDEFFDEYDDGF